MNEWGLWRRVVEHADRDGSHVAFHEVGTRRSLSYRELVDRVNAFVHENQTFGRVLVQSSNRIEYPIQFIAHLLMGNIVFPSSPDTPPAELDRALNKTSRLQPDAGSILLCSSGTTGMPKIVLRTRQSLDVVAKNMVDAIGLTSADRVIAAVPIVHSYGMEHGLLAPLLAGSTVLLCDGLNLQQITTAIQSGATILPAVPSIIEMLNQTADVSTSSLRRVYTAGATLPVSVASKFESRTSVRVGQVYGLTELGSVFVNDPSRDTPGTVGRACNGVSMQINPETNEILIASQSMLNEYVGDSLELIDGHFPTGDIGQTTSSGELMLTGRLKLLIDVGGAKVNPLEVEEVLLTHPQVASAVVLPLRLSETVCKVRAVVVPVDPNDPPDVQQLRQHVRSQLAGYKVPRLIEIRNSLPRSATGKILRHQLEIA